MNVLGRRKKWDKKLGQKKGHKVNHRIYRDLQNENHKRTF